MKKTLFITAVFLILICKVFSQTADFFNETESSKKTITFVDETDIFRLSPLNDSLIAGTGALVFGANFYLDKIAGYNHLDYTTCDFNKSNIPTLDALLMHNYSKPLSIASCVPVVLLAATPLYFVTEPKNEWLTIGVMFAETALWANNFKETAKNLVVRARPYMYYDNGAAAPAKKIAEYDWENSFFSGHTAFSFAFASFTSYLYCRYNEDSKYKYAVVGGTYALAAATGALRIVSGNHFLSDVFCGAVAGTVAGFLIPYFHTEKYWSKNVQVGLVPSGIYLTAHF